MSTFPFFPIASEELRGRSLVQMLGATADTPLSRVRQIVGFPADSIGGSPWPASRLAFGCFVAVCVISLFSWNSLAGAYPPAPKQGNIEVVDAVREFNEENKRLGLGLDQPPLTEDEIVTAIKRSDWKRDAPDVSEREFAAFKAVAETHRLPKDAYLQVWTSEEPEPFTVVHKWQVQLFMPTPEAGFHGFTIRNTTIREEQIDPKSVAWGKPDPDGLSLGLFLLPRKDKYAIGDRVRLRLFVRNDGRKAVEEMGSGNITWPETKDFTATDQTGAKVEVRNSQSKEWSGPAWIAGVRGVRGGRLDPGDVHAFRIPFELGIGGDGSNKLIGRVIDARPGQTLQLRLRAHNGSNRIPAENEPPPESGSVTFTVAAAGDDAGEQAEDKATANRAGNSSPDIPAENAPSESRSRMIEQPSVELLRQLLAPAATEQPEPIELLDAARNRPDHTGSSRIRVIATGADRFAIVEARVRPAIEGDGVVPSDLQRLPECSFVFDMRGKLIAAIGGKVGTTIPRSPSSPERVDVLSLGLEEDWFVRVARFEDNKPFNRHSAGGFPHFFPQQT